MTHLLSAHVITKHQGHRIGCSGASFDLYQGEVIGSVGESGSGKSILMRMIYGNYLSSFGRIVILGLDVVGAEPKDVLALRLNTLGCVGQFLEFVSFVPTFEVVAELLLAIREEPQVARKNTESLLERLRIPCALCDREIDISKFKAGSIE